jgi:hypothetical protein
MRWLRRGPELPSRRGADGFAASGGGMHRRAGLSGGCVTARFGRICSGTSEGPLPGRLEAAAVARDKPNPTASIRGGDACGRVRGFSNAARSHDGAAPQEDRGPPGVRRRSAVLPSCVGTAALTGRRGTAAPEHRSKISVRMADLRRRRGTVARNRVPAAVGREPRARPDRDPPCGLAGWDRSVAQQAGAAATTSPRPDDPDHSLRPWYRTCGRRRYQAVRAR